MELVSKSIVSVTGRLEVTQCEQEGPKESLGHCRDPSGRCVDVELQDGQKGKGLSPKRGRDSRGRWADRKADKWGEKPKLVGEPARRQTRGRGEHGRAFQESVWDLSVKKEPWASHAGLFWGSFPVSSSSCTSSLALPAVVATTATRDTLRLRSGTRHAIAKQPEAGYLEGTGRGPGTTDTR